MAKLSTITFLALAIVVVFACTQSPPNTPTPDIDATIQAAVVASIPTPTPEPSPDVEATIQASVLATTEASTPDPTATSPPTNTPIPPADTPTPVTTDIPEDIECPDLVELPDSGDTPLGPPSSLPNIFTGTAYVNGAPAPEGELLYVKLVTSRSHPVNILEGGKFKELLHGPVSDLDVDEPFVFCLGDPEGTAIKADETFELDDEPFKVIEVEINFPISPTNAAKPLPTDTIVSAPTNTPTPISSETPEPTSTETPPNTPIPTSTSTLTPVPTQAPDTVSTTRTSYGPKHGTLLHTNHNLDNYFASGFDVANFIAEVTFTIPENLVDFDWVGCIDFRTVLPVGWQPDDDFQGYLICINSLGTWFHILAKEGVEQPELIYENTTTTIRKEEGDINKITIVASESSGILFINDIFVGELDLSELTSSGTIDIVAIATTGTSPTQFTNFKIAPLRKVYGPGVGEIEHHMQTTGEIDGKSTLALVTDGIIEAQFINPFIQEEGSWSNGFLFRQADYDYFHVIIASSSGWWYHGLRLGDPTNEDRLAGEASEHISTERNGVNRVRVVALGDQGWLFINGVYIDQLDLSGLVEAGYVSAIGSYFQDDGIAGYSTPFEDFTIWSAD